MKWIYYLQSKLCLVSLFHLCYMSFFLLLMSTGLSQVSMETTDIDKSSIKTVAILPFDNVSGEPDAARRVTSIFLTELFSRNQFLRVIELGEVEKVLIEERLRNTGEIEVELAKKLGEKLKVDYLILGSVVEYTYARLGNNDYPVIGITARAIDAKTGKIIWSDHQYGRGNQKEKIFGIGRIISLSQLSEMIIKKLVDSFEKKIIVLKYR